MDALFVIVYVFGGHAWITGAIRAFYYLIFRRKVKRDVVVPPGQLELAYRLLLNLNYCARRVLMNYAFQIVGTLFVFALLAHQYLIGAYFLGAVVFIRFLCGADYRDRMSYRIAQLNNLRNAAINECFVEGLIQHRDKFALVLRNFGLENELVPDNIQWDDSGAGRGNLVTYNSYIYISPILRVMPIIGFWNQNDTTDPDLFQRVYVEDSWQDCFDIYARRAAIILVLGYELTPGLLFELEWIKLNEAGGKTVCVVSNDEVSAEIEKLNVDIRVCIDTRTAGFWEINDKRLELSKFVNETIQVNTSTKYISENINGRGRT